MRVFADGSPAQAPAAAPLALTINIQGRIETDGLPADGSYDFQFELFASNAGADTVAAAVSVEDQPVANGVFSVPVAFGAGAFPGEPRFVEIRIRQGASSGAYEILGRQELTATPYSLFALTSGDAWHLSGNAAQPGAFIGTTNPEPLILKQNNDAAVRYFRGPDALNVVAGYSSNAISPGVSGSLILGGGASGNVNYVTDDFSVVAGGSGNQAGNGSGPVFDGWFSFVGGGTANQASAPFSFVGGGDQNFAYGSGGSVIVGGTLNKSHGLRSFIGSGIENDAFGVASVIGGGSSNQAGNLATVPGGDFNRALGNSSFAAGSHAIVNGAGTFMWADSLTTSDFASAVENAFIVKAANGLRLTQNSPSNPGGIGNYYRDNAIIAWAKVQVTAGVPAVSSGFGITGITRSSDGVYVLTLANGTGTGFAGNLIPVASAEIDSAPGNTPANWRFAAVDQITTNTIGVYISNGLMQAVDNDFTVMVTGR